MALIVFDIGGTAIKSGLYVGTKHSGKVILRKTFPTYASSEALSKHATDPVFSSFHPALQSSLSRQQTAFFLQLHQCITWYQWYAQRHRLRIEGLAIGMPGPFEDKHQGILANIQNLPLKHFHFGAYLKKTYRLDFAIANDAQCFALGEVVSGKAKGYDHVLGITLGTGLGVGIVIHGRSYDGKGNAGEFSHSPYLDSVYEAYISKRALLGYAKQRGVVCQEPAMLASKRYQALWNQFGFHLAHALSTLANTFDPQMIVIGGNIAKSHALFMSAVHAHLSRFLLVKKPKIVVSLRQKALEGAVAYFYHQQL